MSIRASKFFINQLGLERSQKDEPLMDTMQREAANSEDFKEATRSFIEKRKPVFTADDRILHAGLFETPYCLFNVQVRSRELT